VLLKDNGYFTDELEQLPVKAYEDTSTGLTITPVVVVMTIFMLKEYVARAKPRRAMHLRLRI